MAGPLGTGDYQVQIRRRGGGGPSVPVAWGNLGFTRRLDEMSDATVTVPVTPRNAGDLSDITSWRDELAIYRNDELAWAGAIHRDPRFSVDEVTVMARDLWVWFERRWLPFDRRFVRSDLAVIFEQLALDALSQDTSPNIAVLATLTGVLDGRTVLAAVHRRAADELRELAAIGVDWTFVGREMRVGGEEIPTEASFTLVDEHVEEPVLDPAEVATMVAALGTNSGAAGVPEFGEAGGVDATRGLVQVVVNSEGSNDPIALRHQAEGTLSLLDEATSFVSCRLTRKAPVDLDQLVPGARVRLAISQLARTIVGDFRLIDVGVSAGVDDDGVKDVVSVSLGPLGRVA